MGKSLMLRELLNEKSKRNFLEMKLDHWKSNKHSYEFLDSIEIAMIFSEHQIYKKRMEFEACKRKEILAEERKKRKERKTNEIDWDPFLTIYLVFIFRFLFLYFHHIRSFDFCCVLSADYRAIYHRTYTWIENRWNTTCVYLWLFNNNVLNQYSILGAMVRGVRSQIRNLFMCASDSGRKIIKAI